MSSELIAAIVGAILGVGLTALSSWVLIKAQDKKTDSKRQTLFKTAIIDDLEASEPLLDNLKSTWEKTTTVHFEYTIELKERRTIYKRFSEQLLLFPADLRAEILKYYIKTDLLINVLEAFQNRKYILQDQYKQVIKTISTSDQSLTSEQTNHLAMSLMKEENQEYSNLENLISKSINDLVNYKLQIRSLIDKLKNL